MCEKRLHQALCPDAVYAFISFVQRMMLWEFALPPLLPSQCAEYVDLTMEFSSREYTILAGLACSLVLYVIWKQSLQWRSARNTKRGALEAPIASGMSLVLEGIKALKAHRVLELSKQRFHDMNATTIHMIVPGGDFHITCQPENVKTMLSTDFKKWGLESSRKTTFKPAIGEGESIHRLINQ